MPWRGLSRPPAEPVVKPYGCDWSLSQLQFYKGKGYLYLEIPLKLWHYRYSLYGKPDKEGRHYTDKEVS